MMRKLIFICLLFSAAAMAETVNDDCNLAWDYETPLPANVDGFRMFVDNVQTWEGTETTITCTEAGMIEGLQRVHVVAYNAKGNSAPSNEISAYVVSLPPGSVINLRFN